MEFSIGMGPAIISKKLKKDPETIYSIRCLPIGGYVSMAGENMEDDNEKQLDIPYQRTINGIDPWKRAIITVAGVVFNFILAIILLAIFSFGNGVPTNDNKIKVLDNSLAADAGLSSGDKIISVEDIIIKNLNTGEIIYSDCVNEKCTTENFTYFKAYLDSDALKNATADYLKDNPNAKVQQQIHISYIHGNEAIEKTVPLTRIYNNETKAFPLLGLNEATRIPGVFEGFSLTFKRFGEIIVLMGQAIASIFTKEGFNNLGGVVSMYQMSEYTANQGFFSYVWYLAIISINLGFFNLLPIPALDGARFYISIAEGVSKKKLNPKIEGYMNLVGLVLLFGLMIVVTVKDIIGLF
jgi:regulator of sigma E protease